MSSPAIEILKFSASDAYKQDPSVLDEALQLLSKDSGVTGVWYGPELQEPQYSYIVIQWAFKDPNNKYTEILTALRKAWKGVAYVKHVHFPEPVEQSLNAPVTELAVVDVKETTDMDNFEEKGTALTRQIKESVPDEIFPGSRGTVDESPRQFIVCLGWHSVERFKSELPKHPELLSKIAAVKELADVDLKHAKLTKYSSN